MRVAQPTMSLPTTGGCARAMCAPFTSHQTQLRSLTARAPGRLPRNGSQAKGARAHSRALVLAAASASSQGQDSAQRAIKTVGVLGGGQLGLMLAEAAEDLGLRIKVLDPTPGCPASSVAEQVHGSFTDPKAIAEFAKGVDMLTVEIEHVDADALEAAAAAAGIEAHPSPAVLRVIQDKWAQKQHFAAAGVPCAPAGSVASEVDLAAFGEEHGYPFMLKARRLAYDGRGNAVVDSPDTAAAAVTALGGYGQGLYAEAWVPFKAEVAVMVVRDRRGNLTPFPAVQTLHRDSICVLTEAPPAGLPPSLCELAQSVAMQAVASLPGAGVYGVELFLVEGGGTDGNGAGVSEQDGAMTAATSARLLLNEVAPRPHNSGHYTIEACATSQYAAHLQAVMGLPVGPTALTCGAAIMGNILGDAAGEEANAARVAAMRKTAEQMPGCALHWYGKAGYKDKRKLGHFTVTASNRAAARRALAKVDANLADELERTAPLTSSESAAAQPPRVGILMGSDSDLPTMRAAAEVLTEFGVPVEVQIVSAHRTPGLMAEYASRAAARGVQVIIAGAGGAAHLPGMLAAQTPLPVIGVPVVPAGARLDGMDALLSICQMPKGVPVATVAIGNAANAGLLAVRILASSDPELLLRMEEYQAGMTSMVMGKRETMAAEGWQMYGLKK